MTRQTNQSHRRTGDNNNTHTNGHKRPSRDRRQDTFRVNLDMTEALELRSLLRDDEGDADEDHLDDVIAAMAPGANRTRTFEETATIVTIRMSLDEKSAVRRAIGEQWRDGDIGDQKEVVRKLDLAIAKAQALHN